MGKHLIAARECIGRAAETSWWKWDKGSRPFFWRWPEEFMMDVRDGIKPWISKSLPQYKAKKHKGSQNEDKVIEKVNKVREAQYISEGLVYSTIDVFDVPKGDEDIRLVYNGTSCGLNDCLWAPWFPLPTIDTHSRGICAGTYMNDLDVGDQFHNFILHQDLQPYVGVNFATFPKTVKTCIYDEVPVWDLNWDEKRVGKVGERWTRLCMGLKLSPYNAVQTQHRFDEVLFLNEWCSNTNSSTSYKDGIFSFSQVVLNLPGNTNYDPSMPWIYKATADGRIACDMFTYVDDQRVTGPNEELCWKASQRVVTQLSYSGIQSAARKRREVSTDVGAWAGSVI